MNGVPAAVPPTSLEDFVTLSAILTGIAKDQLHPQLDTFGTAQEYLNYATANGGPAFTQLMSLYLANRTQPSDSVAKLILEQSGDEIAYMARTVMLMWYLGAWYNPAGLQAYHADTSVPAPFVVISSNAYTQSWVWRVGQTHPMGYSNWRFGYWNTPPQPLTDFIGGG
jgi:hypothetical protein